MTDGPLRQRLVEVEADQARQAMMPILEEMKDAARHIRRNAAQVEEAVQVLRRSHWERLLTTVLVGVLLLLLAVLVLQPGRDLSEEERRRLLIGERVEHVWGTLSQTEKEILEHALQ